MFIFLQCDKGYEWGRGYHNRKESVLFWITCLIAVGFLAHEPNANSYRILKFKKFEARVLV